MREARNTALRGDELRFLRPRNTACQTVGNLQYEEGMDEQFHPNNPERFQKAIELIDAANAADPNHELINRVKRPREVVYAERLTAWILRLRPNASEALRLATRSQHIRRWEIPRNSHPMTREGYLRWKEALKRMHAHITGEILREVGYEQTVIERVQSLNLKLNLKKIPECQTLQDALCLLFLEHQLVDLANRTSEEKVITALKKSWAKMSSHGHEVAMTLKFEPRESALLRKAIA